MSGSETAVSQALSKSERARLLEVRRAIKRRTPDFQRQESWRYVRIHDPWRKPKGIDSHMRLSVKGWPALVKVGYRVPRKVRGLHPSGYRDVVVHNVNELETLSPQSDAARLAAGVGRKKKIEIAKRARELGIRVLNGRNLLVGAKTVEGQNAKDEKSSGKKPSESKSSALKGRRKKSD